MCIKNSRVKATPLLFHHFKLQHYFSNKFTWVTCNTCTNFSQHWRPAIVLNSRVANERHPGLNMLQLGALKKYIFSCGAAPPTPQCICHSHSREWHLHSFCARKYMQNSKKLMDSLICVSIFNHKHFGRWGWVGEQKKNPPTVFIRAPERDIRDGKKQIAEQNCLCKWDRWSK